MANKTRKDRKGYALRTGECQRKDGRYSFSYTDRWKKRHTVYATSLVELRELEKQIRMDIDSGINPPNPTISLIMIILSEMDLDKRRLVRSTTQM